MKSFVIRLSTLHLTDGQCRSVLTEVRGPVLAAAGTLEVSYVAGASSRVCLTTCRHIADAVT